MQFYANNSGGWNQTIAQGSGDASSPALQPNFVGSGNQLSGVSWVFEVDYSQLSGYRFSLTSVTAGNPDAASWTTVLQSMNPMCSFNAIQINSVVGSCSGATNTLSFDDISFSCDGAATSGLLTNLDNAGNSSGGQCQSTEWIVASTDLSTTDWTLKGTVTGAFAGAPSGDPANYLQLNVVTANGVSSPDTGDPAPEPAALVVWTLLAGAGDRRRLVAAKAGGVTRHIRASRPG